MVMPKLVGSVGGLLLLVGALQLNHVADVAGKESCGQLRAWNLQHGDIPSPVPGAAEDELREAKAGTTKARLNLLVSAIEWTCLRSGRYPETFQAVLDATNVLPRTNSCFLEPFLFRDGWDQPIYFAASGAEVWLSSAGSDGIFGTGDDIGPPEESGEPPSECRELELDE